MEAKAWKDDAIEGITSLPIFIKNHEALLEFLNREDLVKGDTFGVVLTTTNPMGRSMFGSETTVQIEIGDSLIKPGVDPEEKPGVDIEGPELPATGYRMNNTFMIMSVTVILVGLLFLIVNKRRKEQA